MFRYLQNLSYKNIDATFKAGVAMKRGSFVTKDEATKTVSLAVAGDSLEDIFIVDRGLVDDDLAFYTLSDYEDRLENIKKDEFVNLNKIFAGERIAVSEYTGLDTDLASGKYLKVANGQLTNSATPTKIKSLGFVDDCGHKLLAFEIA